MPSVICMLCRRDIFKSAHQLGCKATLKSDISNEELARKIIDKLGGF